jgi:vitamin B12 transporter
VQKFFSSLGALALASALILSPASADETPADETDENDQEAADYEVRTVAPARRSIEDRRLPSGYVTRVGLDDQSRRGRDLGDALGRVPGINVRRSAGPGRPAFASVRGGNSRQIVVSLNGMRISAPAGLGFDVGSLSLAGIDGVDVHRGGAATVHGAGALTGALDLKTRLPDEPGWRAEATSVGGSWGTYGAEVGGVFAEPDYAVGVDAGWRRSAGDFAFVDPGGATQQRLNNDHRQYNALANGRVRLGEHVIEPLALYERGEGGAPGTSEFQRQFEHARLGTERAIGQLGWQRQGLLSGGWGVLDARALIGVQRRTLDYDNPQAFPGDAHISDTSTLDGVEADAEASMWFDFGNLLHVSVEGRREAFEAAHQASYDASTDSAAIDATRNTVAAGLSNELLLFEDAVSLVGALRVEHLADSGGPSAGERSWTPLMPAAGLMWRAHRLVELKANVARTFRAPDFDELYLNMVGLRGDAALEPERAVTVDAGTRLGPEDGPASLEAVVFRNDIEESIAFIARSAYLFEAANLGSGTAQGAEATLSLRPHARLDLAANYTFTHARLDAMAEGVQTPGQPLHHSGARAEAELGGLGPLDAISSLRVFAEATWRSRMWLDTFGHLSADPFWTADAGLAVEPVDAVELTFSARNLTDNRRGADHLHRPLPGRAFYVALSMGVGNARTAE